ncbi:MAG: dihydroorotate dehydrogenase electron transfer subunit, partial [Clostridia bacterium]|nr:dihydroorotate dehydrogenase electron transfer subunit [Clostridia bacterium]
MLQSIFTVTENIPLTKDVMKMTLTGDCSHITVPGQFVNLKLQGRFLRRPISVCDREGDTLTLIYKIVGGGTEDMSRMAPGTEVDILTGLGNGYDLSKAGDHPLLIGGGVGVPPLYGLCKKLLDEGKKPHVILGFNTAEEVFLKEDFEALGAQVTVATADGSMG